MPPVDRGEYFQDAGAAVGPLFTAADADAVAALRRDEDSPPPDDVLSPQDFRVEYAEAPLGVEARSPYWDDHSNDDRTVVGISISPRIGWIDAGR